MVGAKAAASVNETGPMMEPLRDQVYFNRV